MDCFLNHIGIKSNGNTQGLFINQLPGVTLKMINAITETEQIDFEGVWDEIQKRSLRKFRKDFISKFKNKYVGFCCDEDACNPEIIACNNISLFEDAWMYCLGTELMIERLYSSRLNKFTSIDKEAANELKDYYQVEYEKALNYAIKYIPKEIIDQCFECRSQVGYVEVLP